MLGVAEDEIVGVGEGGADVPSNGSFGARLKLGFCEGDVLGAVDGA